MFGDVTSGNIVGYAGSQLDDEYGNVLLSAQFAAVGNADKKIYLGALKPVASVGTVGNRKVTIQTLTAGGTMDQYYRWNGSKWIYSSDGADANDVELPAGKGLWVSCSISGDEATVVLQGSGEVNQQDIVARLDGEYGNVAVGNGFPVAVKLGTIVPEALVQGETVGNRKVTIQTLTSGGTMDQYYRWNGSKWVFAADNTDANDEEIPAGKALWVSCSIPAETTPVDLRIVAPKF